MPGVMAGGGHGGGQRRDGQRGARPAQAGTARDQHGPGRATRRRRDPRRGAGSGDAGGPRRGRRRRRRASRRRRDAAGTRDRGPARDSGRARRPSRGCRRLRIAPPVARPAPATPSYTRNNPPAARRTSRTPPAQQAFISQIAPGAMAAQSRYGVPAAVTIAQAIDESGWGQSALAIRDNNLFGIKGTGPAGSDVLPTQEFENGQWVTRQRRLSRLPQRGREHCRSRPAAGHRPELSARHGRPAPSRRVRDRPDRRLRDRSAVRLEPHRASCGCTTCTNMTRRRRPRRLRRFRAGPPIRPGTVSQARDRSVRAAYGQSGRNGQPGRSGRAHDLTGSQGAATIPGVLDAYTAGPGRTAPAAQSSGRSGPRRPASARGRGSRLAGRSGCPARAGTCRRSRRPLRPPSSPRRRPR